MSEAKNESSREAATSSDLLGVKPDKRTVFFTMVMHPLK